MSDRPTPEQLRERLRDAGLRATRARVAVLELLHHVGAPRSHAEVVAQLHDEGWDRATLYRNLVDMSDAGLLRRVDLGDHVWRFELARAGHAAPGDDHPHFLCTACGEVSCLPELALPTGRGVPRSVQAGDVAIEIRGLCDACVDV